MNLSSGARLCHFRVEFNPKHGAIGVADALCEAARDANAEQLVVGFRYIVRFF